MFKRILFPTDGSDSSLSAQKYVLGVAKAFQAEVTILHSYEFLEMMPIFDTPYAYLNELDSYLKEQSETVVLEVSEVFKKEGIVCDGKSIKGDPGFNITNLLDSGAYDLVVMGSRGLGAIKRFVMGSVSQYVVNHTECPVLIVSEDDESESE